MGRRISDRVLECVREINDPEVAHLFRQSQRSPDGGKSPLPISWFEINFDYTEEERRAADWFHLRFRRSYPEYLEGEGTCYDESTACPFCGVGRKQLSPLILPKLNTSGWNLLLLSNGEVLCSRSQAQAWVEAEVRGVTFYPVYKTNKAAGALEGLPPVGEITDEWIADKGMETNRRMLERIDVPAYQILAPGLVEISPSTAIGVEPFVDLKDESVCPLANTSGSHSLGHRLLGPLRVSPFAAEGRDFALTRQATGQHRGLFLPMRKLILAKKAVQLAEPALTKWTAFDPLEGGC
jgi:rubredoxin